MVLVAANQSKCLSIGPQLQLKLAVSSYVQSVVVNDQNDRKGTELSTPLAL